MAQGFKTIDKIIREECLAQEDFNLSRYMRYLSFGLEAVKDWSLNTKTNIKVISTTTTALATLPFPADYVKWSRIGTVVGDRVKTMVVNNKLALNFTIDDCGQPVANTPYTPDYRVPGYASDPFYLNGYPFFNFLAGDTSGSVPGFGNGYKNDGQFRVDQENRRFQFSSDWASKTVYLEYVGTGLNPSGETVVNENAAKAIKWYIRWQNLETKRGVSMAEKMRAEQQYWSENLTANKRILDIDLDKILAIQRSSQMTTPKS